MTEHIFLTGATGFLGAYVMKDILKMSDARILPLVRAKSKTHAMERLWEQAQVHMDEASFRAYWPRIHPILGDLHQKDLGLSEEDRKLCLSKVDSVLHIAASLNRKSAKACLNTNLRGTLSVLLLAKAIDEKNENGGLRRYSHVSTVAVAGKRHQEVVLEDEAIDWSRSDYDPYGRTKKFCEHMAKEILPDVQKTFFRPSIVMGDSKTGETTQFDMVRAFCFFADLPLIPLLPDVKLDIVNADWVGQCVATLHLKAKPKHEIYHLSAGKDALSCRQVANALTSVLGRKARFAPYLLPIVEKSAHGLASMKARNAATYVGSLISVFLPYITWDTVFSNERVTQETGLYPSPFSDYCGPLYAFSKACNFSYTPTPLGSP